jgi:hypothetical protein
MDLALQKKPIHIRALVGHRPREPGAFLAPPDGIDHLSPCVFAIDNSRDFSFWLTRLSLLEEKIE